MADNSTNRGFASMVNSDPDKQREIASKGGKASSGSFDNNPERASTAGKRGASNQPVEAKRRGGQNSHRNR